MCLHPFIQPTDQLNDHKVKENLCARHFVSQQTKQENLKYSHKISYYTATTAITVTVAFEVYQEKTHDLA